MVDARYHTSEVSVVVAILFGGLLVIRHHVYGIGRRYHITIATPRALLWVLRTVGRSLSLMSRR